MPSMQSLDIQKRSATTTASPQARQAADPVAKLIDISKCIGCKACQVACMQWNDLRDDIGTNVGVYDNPIDLTDQSWTVMRFSEISKPPTVRLEWLIRKDGCMHCEDPGCLKACPAPGAIVKYANGIVDFISENCIGCGYCIAGCPFNIPRISKKDNKAYKCTLCSDRVNVGLEPACVKTCPTGAISSAPRRTWSSAATKRVNDLKERGFQNAGAVRPARGGRHARDVRAAARATSRSCITASRAIRRSVRGSACGRASPSRYWRWAPGSLSSARSSTTSRVVRRKWTTQSTEAEPWLSS